jgi:hypothetical protein
MQDDWVIVLFGTEDGNLVTGPALEREGNLWLVPQWLESPDGTRIKPAHAIRLPSEAVLPTPGNPSFQFRLNGSVPKAAIQDAKTSELLGLRFEVRVAPEWILDLQPIH